MILLLLVLGSLIFVDVASACSSPPPMPPDVIIIKHSPTHYWIIFIKYTTFGASTNQFCACALRQVPPITAINAAKFVVVGADIDTFTFVPNPEIGSQFAALGGGGTWQGFSGTLNQAVPAGLELRIHFDVDVEPGSTTQDLIDGLSAQGLNVIGTDETDAGGTLLQGAHFAVFPAGIITDKTTAVPALGSGGLAVLGLMFLMAVWIGIRRSRSGHSVVERGSS
ncbi:MAG: hypothetical protein D6696_13635 [Acidobacteria bacterium]|nr:MAG: hypothetical protein D6696_13635 [Acidobacteriota bacterium]